MYGYNGKILRIDLTNRNCTLEPLDEEKAKKFIGARGLGVKTLLEEIDLK